MGRYSEDHGRYLPVFTAVIRPLTGYRTALISIRFLASI
jgi:hypothetical protein